MRERIQPYKKYFGYGIMIITIGALLFLANKVIDNGTVLLAGAWNQISHFLDIVSPVIMAFIYAYLLYYPVTFVENQILELFAKKGVTQRQKSSARIISIVVMYGFVVILLITIINFIVPPLIENIKILINSIPQFEKQISGWITEMSEFLATLNIEYVSSGDFMEQVKNILFTLGQSIINGLGSFIGQTSSFILNLVISLILTFYFLKDREKLFGALDKFGTIIFCESIKQGIKGFVKDLDDVVGKFLVGTILDSFIVGIVSTVLMLLIGHPFAMLIGVAAGITNVIPYVGPVIGAGLSFGLGIFTSLSMGLLGAGLLLLYQQIDGNFVQPKIVGDKVGLAPVWILIAVLIGGSYFGGLGMIIAVPTAGLISIYIDRLYKKKIK